MSTGTYSLPKTRYTFPVKPLGSTRAIREY